MKKILFILTVAMLMLSCKKESIEPISKSSTELNGSWLVGSSTEMSINATDTTYTTYEYIGDGVCCSPVFEDASGASYTIGDNIEVGGDIYQITDYSDGDGLDDDYRYFVSLEIISPYSGCKVTYDLFKRSVD